MFEGLFRKAPSEDGEPKKDELREEVDRLADELPQPGELSEEEVAAGLERARKGRENKENYPDKPPLAETGK